MKEGKSNQNKEKPEVKTFPVPFALGEIKENITTNTPSKISEEQIINQAFKFHSQGNISEAAKYYQYFINQGFKDHRVFSNYGFILKYFGKLQEAELYTRKAIESNPNFADAHSNLGLILKDLGELKEAELYTRRAIDLNHNFANAYYNLGLILRDLGEFQEAEISTRKAIEINPNFADAHLNLGVILKDLGKLKDAELSTRKVIELNAEYGLAYLNLGNILKNLGELKEAEMSYLKAIELNPDFSKAYYSLSLLNYSNDNKKWQYQLFTQSILNNKSQNDLVDIYYARTNILHKERNYAESSRYLKLVNKLQLDIKPSNPERIFNKSKALLIESNKKEEYQKETEKYPESIFILGMHRSGTTLAESIISMNKDVDCLGDINILEESFIESKKIDQRLSLAELYSMKVNNLTSGSKITTNKRTYNYQYSGIIISQIPNAKIIHCFRHPLDNILSLYRTYFSTGQEYFSSLIDCARVYLDQEEIMTEYKNRFRSKIYDLNYDSLVRDPKQEIRFLISWLGWEWDDSYLEPHLNPRSVSIDSNSSVQVRSPINSKALDGWKHYKDMLEPAIKIIIQNHRYRDLIK